jgi:hypothetical protein
MDLRPGFKLHFTVTGQPETTSELASSGAGTANTVTVTVVARANAAMRMAVKCILLSMKEVCS